MKGTIGGGTKPQSKLSELSNKKGMDMAVWTDIESSPASLHTQNKRRSINHQNSPHPASGAGLSFVDLGALVGGTSSPVDNNGLRCCLPVLQIGTHPDVLDYGGRGPSGRKEDVGLHVPRVLVECSEPLLIPAALCTSRLHRHRHKVDVVVGDLVLVMCSLGILRLRRRVTLGSCRRGELNTWTKGPSSQIGPRASGSKETLRSMEMSGMIERFEPASKAERGS